MLHWLLSALSNQISHYIVDKVKPDDNVMLCRIRFHVTLLTRYHQKRQELEKLRCDLADTEAKLATQEVLLNEVSELIETTGENIPSALEFSADISLEDTGSTVSYFDNPDIHVC